MTQRKPGNILIALLISSLAFANPMMAAKRAMPKKTTVTITVDGDAAVDAAGCDAPCATGCDAPCADAVAKAKAKTDAPCADAAACTDSCPLEPTRVLAPAQAGGVIVTPAFEYSIKSSDFSTPQAIGGTAATPAASSVMFYINTPGRYYLASDTAARVSTGFINTTMIYINANNVIFDMNGKTLFPNGTAATTNAAGLTAIRVAPSLSNVVIKNGQISGYQPNGTVSYITTGIIVGAGCSNFTISDINISNIGGTTSYAPNAGFALGVAAAASAGLQINFGSGPTACANFILQNINVSNTNTANASTPAAGLILFTCNNIKVNSCSFGSSIATGTGTPTAYGVYMGTCNTVDFNGCTAAQNGTGSTNAAIGFFTTSTTAVNFTDCSATQTSGAAVSGFTLATTGPYKLTNCTASNATGTTAVYGFNISALSTLTGCSAESNTASAGTCYGIYITGADGSKLINCQSNQNSGTAGQAAGIYISTSDGVLMQDCTTNGNSGTAASVSGFYLTGSDSCRLESCMTGENSSATASIPVYGFYTDGTSSVFNNCIAGHNQNTTVTGTAIVAGFYLSSTSGNQIVNCQARNNSASSTGACTAAGFYSTGGTANEFRNCQAINNAAASSLTGVAAGIELVTETRSQILDCNCSANNTSSATSSNTSTAAGIYLITNSSNTVVRDNLLNFNASGYLQFGFYDSAGETTSVLINNQAAGQGRCTALLSTSFHFPSATPMNFYFQSEGTNENPRNIIVETDNFNWQTISTAVPAWSNISIVIGQVS
jgi:parallel beta-helix repeat protein